VEFEELRLIVLNERGSGKLSDISPDVFKKAKRHLNSLYNEAQSIDNFLTDKTADLLNEIESVESSVQDIIHERSKKILKLAINQTESRYVDKNEMNMMLSAEKEMYHEIVSAMERCRMTLFGEEIDIRAPDSAEVKTIPVVCESAQDEAHVEKPGICYSLIRVLDDIDAFVGVDGKIYSLSKEDVVSVPEMNARVLCDRNIALNISVSK
jgi:DNA replication factor GINS